MNVHQFKTKLKEMNFDSKLNEEVNKIIEDFLNCALMSPSSHTKCTFSKSMPMRRSYGHGPRDEQIDHNTISVDLLAIAVSKELKKRGFIVKNCTSHDDQREGVYLTISVSWSSDDADQAAGDSRDLDYRY